MLIFMSLTKISFAKWSNYLTSHKKIWNSFNQEFHLDEVECFEIFGNIKIAYAGNPENFLLAIRKSKIYIL